MPVETQATATEQRLFFALWPDADTRDRIVVASRSAVVQSRGRAVPSANLHVTLAFIGNVGEALAKALARLPRVACKPFVLELDRLSYARGARMLWLEPSSPPAELMNLEVQLWRRLGALGFERDRRRFRPHVTLVRGSARVRTELAQVAWTVADYALVQSQSSARGSRYTPLRTWALAR